MVELGLFDEERIELLSGVMVAMSPKRPAHSGATQALKRLLVPALVGRAEVRVQEPLALAEDSEPEPDIAIVRPGDYMTEHPDHAVLIAEVADTTLRKDRVVKGPIYAKAGVPEYWIVNLIDGVVERYTESRADGYQRLERMGRDGRLAPLAFPDVVLRVADFLP